MNTKQTKTNKNQKSKKTGKSKKIKQQNEQNNIEDNMLIQKHIDIQQKIMTKQQIFNITIEKIRSDKQINEEQLDILLSTYYQKPLYSSRQVILASQIQIRNNQISANILVLKAIIINSYKLSFMKSQKAVIMFQNLAHQIKNKRILLNIQQLKQMKIIYQKLSLLLQQKHYQKWIQKIFEHVIYIFYELSQTSKDNIQINFCLQIIKSNISLHILKIQSNSNIQLFKQKHLQQLILKSMKIMVQINTNQYNILPYYDISCLSFCSHYCLVYKNIIQKSFIELKIILDDKKQQKYQHDMIISQNINQIKINSVLMLCNIFSFNSIFNKQDSQIASNKYFYKDQVIFLTIIQYKHHLNKLIQQLQKIQKCSIPQYLIKQMFQLAFVCSNLNKKQKIIAIINKMGLQKYSKILINSLKINITQQQNTLQNIVNISQRQVFDLSYKIQKIICFFNIKIILNQFIENPLIFRSQFFIQSIFKQQYIETILQLMILLTKKWLNKQFASFDFSFYLLHFFKKCILKDNIQYVGKYLKNISIQNLLQINTIIYKLSFIQQKKKLYIPQRTDFDYELSQLTSAGYSDRFMFFNKLMESFPEQLSWRQLIKQFLPNQYYIIVKLFYRVINYQINFKQQNINLIKSILKEFTNNIINLQMEQTFSTLHLLLCILHKKQLNNQQYANKRQIQTQLLFILIQKSNIIINLRQQTCQRRRSALSHVVLSKQMMNESLKYLQNSKKMDYYFLKSICKWMDSLQKINQIINPVYSLQKILDIYDAYSKQYQFKGYNISKTLSNFMSSKIFYNTIEDKLIHKVQQVALLPVPYTMMLKQNLSNIFKKKPDSKIKNIQTLTQIDILKYFGKILQFKVDPLSQKEILKVKIIILITIHNILKIIQAQQSNGFCLFFQSLFHKFFKHTILQIALQNPTYVSKYQRQLIIHLRLQAIQIILQNLGKKYQILNEKHIYSFIFQLSIDKIPQIRIIVMNLFSSRFKNQKYIKLLSLKYEMFGCLTFISIFQPNDYLKILARQIVNVVKKICQDECCYSLILLFYCLKHIHNYIYNNLLKDSCSIFIDYFLINFYHILLDKKQSEYVLLNICNKIIEKATFSIAFQSFPFNSYISSYFLSKQRTDFILQSQIKQNLKNNQFCFQEQNQKNNSEIDIRSRIMYGLSVRYFKKLRQIIQNKPRNSRTLKSKKDLYINWKSLQNKQIIKLSNFLQDYGQIFCYQI